MRLVPKYSYEFNCVLNEEFLEDEQIKNFASIISDKDRFLILLSKLENNLSYIEERVGSKFRDTFEFYVVRAEKFKSFSEPITIEYSICPEEMLLYLLKEILKVSIEHRFPDDLIREQHINGFIDFICINCDLGEGVNKFCKNLHDESVLRFPGYEFKELDFSSKTLNDFVLDLYNED